MFSLIELQLKIKEVYVDPSKILGTDLTDGPWCMSCPGPCGRHPVPSSHRTWVMIIIMSGYFLAPTGAQEVTISIRSSVVSLFIALNFNLSASDSSC